MGESRDLLNKQESFLNERLYSLDALRGFDMFWIMGAEEVVHGLAETTHFAFFQSFSDQLRHPAWNGFTCYDLIFPLFIFLAGVSTPYSIGNALEKVITKKVQLKKIL